MCTFVQCLKVTFDITLNLQTNYFYDCLQRADNMSQARPTSESTVRHGQQQKRYSLSNFDTINRGLLPGTHSETQEFNHDDDMRVCPECNQSFHKLEIFKHMEKCGKHK